MCTPGQTNGIREAQLSIASSLLRKSSSEPGWDRRIVIDAGVAGVKGEALRGRLGALSGLKRVRWVELPTQVETTAARGHERSVAVLGKRTETEPTRVSSEIGLGPLLVVGLKANEGLEASANLSIESFRASVWKLAGTTLIE